MKTITATQMRNAFVCDRRGWLSLLGYGSPESGPFVRKYLIRHEMNREHLVPFILDNLYSGEEVPLEEIINAIPKEVVEKRVSEIESDIQVAERWDAVRPFLHSILMNKERGPKVARLIKNDFGAWDRDSNEQDKVNRHALIDKVLNCVDQDIPVSMARLIDHDLHLDRDLLAEGFLADHQDIAVNVYQFLKTNRERKAELIYLSEKIDFDSLTNANNVYSARPDFITFINTRGTWKMAPLDVKAGLHDSERAQNAVSQTVINSHISLLTRRAEEKADISMDVEPADYTMFYLQIYGDISKDFPNIPRNNEGQSTNKMISEKKRIFNKWAKNPMTYAPQFSHFYNRNLKKCGSCYLRVPCIIQDVLSKKSTLEA